MPNLRGTEQYSAAILPRVRRGLKAVTALLAVAILAGCQQKMSNQPAYRPLEGSELFADGASVRPLVAGTVARGFLRDDDHLFTGKVNNELVTSFPMTITREVIKRGQQRYNIYCSPCHSQLGDGDGMIVQRGFSRPPSFHEDRILTAPVGHIYDVITNGFGRMPKYADQIPSVPDRWAIVAYVKTLQLSRQAKIDDIPEAERARLLADASETTVTAGGAH